MHLKQTIVQTRLWVTCWAGREGSLNWLYCGCWIKRTSIVIRYQPRQKGRHHRSCSASSCRHHRRSFWKQEGKFSQWPAASNIFGPSKKFCTTIFARNMIYLGKFPVNTSPYPHQLKGHLRFQWPILSQNRAWNADFEPTNITAIHHNRHNRYHNCSRILYYLF